MRKLDSNGYVAGQWTYKPRGQLYKTPARQDVKRADKIPEEYGMSFDTQSRRDRYRQHNKARFWAEWSLTLAEYSIPTEALDISDYDIDTALYHCADYFREATTKQWWTLALQIVANVVAVVITVVSWGALSPLGAAIAVSANVIGVAAMLVEELYLSNERINQTMISIGTQLMKNDFSKSLQDSNAKAKASSAQQTSFLIYAQQVILPGGAIYNSQQAGSPSYSPSTAYDPNKGINGTYTQDEHDEFTQNRTQANQAGGANYTSNVLNTGFPLASTKQAYEFELERIAKEKKEWGIRINGAMSLLVRQGFGLGMEDKSEFIQRVVKNLTNTHIHRRTKKMLDEDNNYNARAYNQASQTKPHGQIRQYVDMADEAMRKKVQELNDYERPIQYLIKASNDIVKIKNTAIIRKTTLSEQLDSQIPESRDQVLQNDKKAKIQSLINNLHTLIAKADEYEPNNEATINQYVKQYKLKTAETKHPGNRPFIKYIFESERMTTAYYYGNGVEILSNEASDYNPAKLYEQVLTQWQEQNERYQKWTIYQRELKLYETKNDDLHSQKNQILALESTITNALKELDL